MLRVTHQKLVNTHNVLMGLFSQGALKRCHDDEHSIASSTPLADTTKEITKPVTYSQTDYKDVKFWTRQQWRKRETLIKDASEVDSQAKGGMCGGTRCANGENVMMLYIEDKDGKPMDRDYAGDIRDFARLIWQDLYDEGLAPETWGTASRKVQEQYFCEMED